MPNRLYKGTTGDAAVTDTGGEKNRQDGFLQRQEKNTPDFRSIRKYLEMVCMYERKKAPEMYLEKSNKTNESSNMGSSREKFGGNTYEESAALHTSRPHLSIDMTSSA